MNCLIAPTTYSIYSLNEDTGYNDNVLLNLVVLIARIVMAKENSLFVPYKSRLLYLEKLQYEILHWTDNLSFR